MPAKRPEALAKQIHQLLSQAIYFELHDPALDGITVTRVKVSPDLGYADVRLTVGDDDRPAGDAIGALVRAKGALKKKIAQNVRLKRVPELRFHHDDDAVAERRIGELLENLDIPKADDNAGA